MQKIKRETNRNKKKIKVRSKVFGTASRPRLSVYKSNKFIYGQLIDDTTGTTLVAGVGAKNLKSAEKVGQDIAKKAASKKIKTVVFDRNGYIYHGRVKMLADGARKGGLVF